MTGEDLGEESPPGPPDDTIVRTTAEEVVAVARKAHRVEVWLVMVAAILAVFIAGFTGYNTYRLRTVNRHLTGLVSSLEANSEVQQKYNEAHAESAGENFDALITNIKCFTDFFVGFNQAVVVGGPLPDKAILDDCFKRPSPHPPPEPLPSEKRDGKR